MTAARAADQDELEKRFQKANSQFDAGEYQSALEIYNGILEAQPTAGNVWVMRALAKWKLKDVSGARADVAQAIALHPDNGDAYRVRGQIRYEAKDYGASRADFDRAIQLAEAEARALAARDQSGDKERGEQLAQACAELHGMRAEVERKLDDRPAAIADLTRAIELNPDYVGAFFLRAQLHEADGQTAEADADYSRVIALRPQHGAALENRAWLRFHALRWEEAIADGKKVLAIDPAAAASLRVIGYSQFARGDYAAAVAALGAAVDADDTSDAVYALLVRHYASLRLGTADPRLSAERRKRKSEPWHEALLRFASGEIDEEALEAAAKETADDDELLGRACEMHFYVGLARRQAGDNSTARLRFDSAVKTGQKSFVEDALAQAELVRPK